MVDFIDLDRAVKACKENPGVPTNVDRDKWPIQLLFLPYSNATSLRGRRILIVCSTLGNWTPPVPKRIQEKFVVILVKNCAQGRHYGFRLCLYVHGESDSWEHIHTDMEAVARVWAVVEYLVERQECAPKLSFIGMSAGVDQALSILFGNPQSMPCQLEYFVAVCGAWHPSLYDLTAQILIDHDVYIIVQHHKDDRLCPWPMVGDFWERFKKLMAENRKGSLYLNVLDVKDAHIIDRNRHDIGKFIFAQDGFWMLMLTEKESYVFYFAGFL